jgi:hypothetical protein
MSRWTTLSVLLRLTVMLLAAGIPVQRSLKFTPWSCCVAVRIMDKQQWTDGEEVQ